MEEQPKNLKEILSENDNVLSVVFKDWNPSRKDFKKFVDNLAWFGRIFDFQLVGIDKEGMERVKKEDEEAKQRLGEAAERMSKEAVEEAKKKREEEQGEAPDQRPGVIGRIVNTVRSKK